MKVRCASVVAVCWCVRKFAQWENPKRLCVSFQSGQRSRVATRLKRVATTVNVSMRHMCYIGVCRRRRYAGERERNRGEIQKDSASHFDLGKGRGATYPIQFGCEIPEKEIRKAKGGAMPVWKREVKKILRLISISANEGGQQSQSSLAVRKN